MKLLRWLILLLHLLALGLLYATLFNAYIPPRIFPELNLLSLGFPFLLGLNVLFCLFWLVAWRKRGLFFLLAIILLLTPIRRWLNYTPAETQKTGAIKILSFNIKGAEYGTKNIKNYIDAQTADLVILQESYHYKEEQMRLPYRKKMDLFTFYSKYPIINSDRIGNGFAGFIDVDMEGNKVRIINVYLNPFYLDKSMVKPSRNLEVNERKAKGLINRMLPIFKTHQEQVETIKNEIERSPYPVIVGGDFNAVPNSHEYYTIYELLQDSFLEVGNGLGTSFHDYKFPIRIDYLFFSNAFKIKTFQTDRTRKISDHYPIISTFDIKK